MTLDFLSFRYLLNRNRKRLFTVVSCVSVLGVAFGVTALLVSLSVLSGFQNEYKRAILQFNSHLILMRGDEIAEPEKIKEYIYKKDVSGDIMGLTPFIYREGLAVYQGLVKGIVLKGIDLGHYQELSRIKIHAFSNQEGHEKVHGVYLGSQLAHKLKFHGGDIKILIPKADPDTVKGRDFQSFEVLGTFTTGLYEFDSSFVFLQLSHAQELFNLPGRISGWEVWLKNPDRAKFFKKNLKDDLDWSYVLLTWEELNENIFQALKLEKLIFSIIMTVLILVASFNIIVSIIILILEKRGTIAILQALGATWKQIRRIFLMEGMLLTLIGLGLGFVLALVVLFWLQNVNIFKLPEEIYFISRLPVHLNWRDFILSGASTILICLFASSLALRALNQINLIKVLQENR